jgi:hypothetical protein
MYKYGLFALAVVAGLLAYQGGYLGQFGAQVVPTPSGGGGGFGQLVSLSVQGFNELNGSTANLNAELWNPSGTQKIIGETNVNGAPTSLGTSFDNTYSAYVLRGNDNYRSTTDRGPDYYYTKVPVSWTNRQGLITYSDIKLYAEDTSAGTTSMTIYDDNTAETTANVSIATSGTYSKLKLTLTATADQALGSPEFDGDAPLAVCFNESVAGTFAKIELTDNVGTLTIPKFLGGENYVSCWKANTNAILDGKDWTSKIYVELNSGESVAAAGTESIGITVLDKAHYVDDAQQDAVGYEDYSVLGASADTAINSAVLSRLCYVTGI